MDKIMYKKNLLLAGGTNLQKWNYVSVTWWDLFCERVTIYSKSFVIMGHCDCTSCVGPAWDDVATGHSWGGDLRCGPWVRGNDDMKNTIFIQGMPWRYVPSCPSCPGAMLYLPLLLGGFSSIQGSMCIYCFASLTASWVFCAQASSQTHCVRLHLGKGLMPFSLYLCIHSQQMGRLGGGWCPTILGPRSS